MKRFSTAPSRYQRGATLTGYALLVASLVVVSMGSIEAVNQSSETVLGETATDVGTPRDSVDVTKTSAVPATPSWAVGGDPGYCTPGLDGCPLGTSKAFNAAAYAPMFVGGDPATYGGNANGVDLTAQKDDLGMTVFMESLVVMNTEWYPPATETEGSPEVPVASQPGMNVCSFLIHASPSTVSQTFKTKIEFPGTVLGTSWNGTFGTASGTFSAAATYPSNGSLTMGDDKIKYDGSSPTNTVEFEFDVTPGDYDEVRVFVEC